LVVASSSPLLYPFDRLGPAKRSTKDAKGPAQPVGRNQPVTVYYRRPTVDRVERLASGRRLGVDGAWDRHRIQGLKDDQDKKAWIVLSIRAMVNVDP
jgi:hypothetical protein